MNKKCMTSPPSPSSSNTFSTHSSSGQVSVRTDPALWIKVATHAGRKRKVLRVVDLLACNIMSSRNNNNCNNNNNNGGGGGGGKAWGDDDDMCSQCHQSCASGSGMKGSSFGAGFNNNNGGGAGGVGPGVPPIQVTAKVLFGSVSAISALNAERKKKT